MEQCRQRKSAKWIRNLGKRIGSEGWARGSQSRTRRLLADCSSCSRGEIGSPCADRGTDWERSPCRSSPSVEQLTQNWYRQGESDCLIKTKHISKFCASLHDLNLKRCISVTDVGISNLICKCMKLHSIVVCNTSFGKNSVLALCSGVSSNYGNSRLMIWDGIIIL